MNNKDYLIPMAVEEPSVVAAASYMGHCGGFTAISTAPIMRAQVQILGLADINAAKAQRSAATDEIITLANSKDRVLIELGGGCVGCLNAEQGGT